MSSSMGQAALHPRPHCPPTLALVQHACPRSPTSPEAEGPAVCRSWVWELRSSLLPEFFTLGVFSRNLHFYPSGSHFSCFVLFCFFPVYTDSLLLFPFQELPWVTAASASPRLVLEEVSGVPALQNPQSPLEPLCQGPVPPGAPLAPREFIPSWGRASGDFPVSRWSAFLRNFFVREKDWSP